MSDVVNLDSLTGRLSPVAEGTVEIAAWSGPWRIASRTLTVGRAREPSVEISAPTLAIQVGGRVQLSATAYDRGGNATSDRFATWSAEPERIATVDASGLVTAHDTGQVTVTATIGGLVQSLMLEVLARAPADVAVLPEFSGAQLAPEWNTLVQILGARDTARVRALYLRDEPQDEEQFRALIRTLGGASRLAIEGCGWGGPYPSRTAPSFKAFCRLRLDGSRHTSEFHVTVVMAQGRSAWTLRGFRVTSPLS
jgi:hypothetical protein